MLPTFPMLLAFFSPLLGQAEPPAPVVLPGGDSLWQLGASIVVMLGLALARAIWADFSGKKEATFRWAVSTAYHATNELAAMTETTVDDKVAKALGFLDAALKAKGAPPATEAQKAAAQLAWKAMHGAEKVAGAVEPPKAAPVF
jgi:hypothetical protein